MFEIKNTNKKITVLGITFNSEEERKSHFRAELRKKLPELKQMEGFPIGEDEDILNLSDPPFYTACPNPWINDFIEEWDLKKKELETRGNRIAEFDVKEPYAADVSEGKNNPIYMAHSYHTKVPHPAIMRYILRYTQPGDIVFDGFAGTGMTGVAASLCGSKNDVFALNESTSNVGVRNSICSDLSPIATLISSAYNLKFDSINFVERANSILNKIKNDLGWIYETEVDLKKAQIHYVIWSDVYCCNHCSFELNLWEQAVENDGDIIKSEFDCPNCGSNCSKKTLDKSWITYYDSLLETSVSMVKKVPVRVNYSFRGKRLEKNIEQFDIDLIEKISGINCEFIKAHPIPKGDESNRTHGIGITHIHQLFTHRNIICIDRILQEVHNDPFLLAWVTSSLQNVSKMWKFKPDRKGGTLAGTLYTPSLSIEQNPIEVLERKIKSFVKIQYPERGNSIIGLASATNISFMKDHSIDYIFTDPPFGSNLMYSELSCIWEGMIKVSTNIKEEAIVNKSQLKSLYEYQSLMTTSLKEYYRVLKPGKWMTVEFSNTSAAVWNGIQHSIQNAGFVIANLAALDKKQGSFKAITTVTAVKQDLVISCYKPSDEFDDNFRKNQNTDIAIWDFVNEHLKHLLIHLEIGNATTAIIERSPKIIYDRLIAFYIQRGLPVPIDAGKFQQGLKERYIERDGMFFTNEQVQEYDKKKAEVPNFTQLNIFVSNEQDSIYWLRNILEKGRKTESDLHPFWMKEVAGNMRKGDSLPEMRTILEESFLKDENGFWYVPDSENEVDLEKLRNKRLLKQFEIYRIEVSKPKSKIKEVRVEALRAGFKQCYQEKDFKTIVTIGDRIPNNLLMEDEVLLQFYDIASSRI